MKEQINELLQESGSIFRTEDGKTLAAYIGHLTFLNRTFETEKDCLEFARMTVNKCNLSQAGFPG